MRCIVTVIAAHSMHATIHDHTHAAVVGCLVVCVTVHWAVFAHESTNVILLADKQHTVTYFLMVHAHAGDNVGKRIAGMGSLAFSLLLASKFGIHM